MSKIKTIDSFTAQELKMMPKSARPIGVRALSPQAMDEKYSSRVRHGKTAKDHKKKGRSV